MSDHVSFDIQEQILKRLPVRSLLRFKSVSKPWKSLIESSKFITSYGVHHTQPQRLLVRYEEGLYNEKYISFVDDDTFTKQEYFAPTVYLRNDKLRFPRVVGSSHGLLCLYGQYPLQNSDCLTKVAVFWNPSIRTSVGIHVHEKEFFHTTLGFGVCPITSDPTIVKISYSDLKNNVIVPWEVDVFTLSSGTWTAITSSNLPSGSIRPTRSNVVIGRFMYWDAMDNLRVENGGINFNNMFLNGGTQINKLIISFNMTTREFSVIDLPESMAHKFGILSMSKLGDSLAVLEEIYPVWVVWIMDQGVTKSFTKLLTINPPHASIMRLLGFRKTGEPIMETREENEENENEENENEESENEEDENEENENEEIENEENSTIEKNSTLEVYEPSSQHFKDLGIHGIKGSFFVCPYMETLLLLDQSDCIYPTSRR